ncbi:MAG: glycosyltransferase [Desulfovibrio sp.]|jgi:glycosyltransferase involved in cell wall biosynthesis|nr:glycosyltransferase [Desulfovibrio sp.]
MPPLFSIIIPVYNGEETLEQAIKSAALQTLDSDQYEILAIDDGSADSTYELLVNLEQGMENLRVLKNPENCGLGKTRNIGIYEAMGEYITFLDADDRLMPRALELAYRHMNDTVEYDVLYGNIRKIDTDNFTLGERSREGMFNNKEKFFTGYYAYFSQASFYNKKFLIENKILFTEGVFYEDICFMASCVLKAKNTKHIDVYIYLYTVNTKNSITSSLNRKKVKDAFFVYHTLYEYFHLTNNNIEYWITSCKCYINFMVISKIRPCRSALRQILLQQALECISQYDEFKLCSFDNTLFSFDPPKKSFLRHQITKHAIDTLAYGAIIFVAEADYHIRAMAAIARQLQKLGEKTLVLDVTYSPLLIVPRPLPEDEIENYSDVPVTTIDTDVTASAYLTAKAYVCAIDWGAFQNDVSIMQQHHIPTFALYEGICDDNNREAHKRFLPYRNAEHLLAPGGYYRELYGSKRTEVIGLPLIQELYRRPAKDAPEHPVAVINCNFTYSVLENKRDEFLKTAVAACKAAGIDFVVSRHVADKGDLGEICADSRSIYACLADGTLLISRFSTVILEALAMGRPCVYHNPHGERFEKFTEPLGAFAISHSVDSLASEIRKILADKPTAEKVRANAEKFLHVHANILSEIPADVLGAEAIKRIIDADADNFAKRIQAVTIHHSSAYAPVKKAKTEEGVGVIWAYLKNVFSFPVRCATSRIRSKTYMPMSNCSQARFPHRWWP